VSTCPPPSRPPPRRGCGFSIAREHSPTAAESVSSRRVAAAAAWHGDQQSRSAFRAPRPTLTSTGRCCGSGFRDSISASAPDRERDAGAAPVRTRAQRRIRDASWSHSAGHSARYARLPAPRAR
jgi:hypothetical protein